MKSFGVQVLLGFICKIKFSQFVIEFLKIKKPLHCCKGLVLTVVPPGLEPVLLLSGISRLYICCIFLGIRIVCLFCNFQFFYLCKINKLFLHPVRIYFKYGSLLYYFQNLILCRGYILVINCLRTFQESFKIDSYSISFKQTLT